MDRPGRSDKLRSVCTYSLPNDLQKFQKYVWEFMRIHGYHFDIPFYEEFFVDIKPHRGVAYHPGSNESREYDEIFTRPCTRPSPVCYGTFRSFMTHEKFDEGMYSCNWSLCIKYGSEQPKNTIKRKNYWYASVPCTVTIAFSDMRYLFPINRGYEMLSGNPSFWERIEMKYLYVQEFMNKRAMKWWDKRLSFLLDPASTASEEGDVRP